MPKQTWIIAGALSAIVLVLIVFGMVRKNTVENRALAQELTGAHKLAEEQAAALIALSNRLDEALARIAALTASNETVLQTHRSLEEEMRKALEGKDITISELKGKLTVNILDRVLFDSGEAELKPEGAQVLSQVADVLAQHTNRQIHVVGHTDNVPIRRRFASNWELSTARALAAVRFLQERAGVDPRHLGAVGYGEFHPIADNATPEGRARNRRIEIVILPEEIALPHAEPVAAAGP